MFDWFTINHPMTISHYSMGLVFRGKITGKPHISWENHGNIMEFPVSIFPTKLNPLIEEISVISIGGNFMGNW